MLTETTRKIAAPSVPDGYSIEDETESPELTHLLICCVRHKRPPWGLCRFLNEGSSATFGKFRPALCS